MAERYGSQHAYYHYPTSRELRKSSKRNREQSVLPRGNKNLKNKRLASRFACCLGKSELLLKLPRAASVGPQRQPRALGREGLKISR